MHVLVTGAAGFIGSNLCDHLLSRGDSVVGLDSLDPYYDPAIKRRTLDELRARPDADRFTFVEADIRQHALVDELFQKHRFDGVAHLAGLAGVRYSVDKGVLYNDVNVTGTLRLLDAARDHQLRGAFVFASTSSVYARTKVIPFVETDPCDRPLAPYPATKRSAELMGHAYHHLHGLHFTALRFFTVYGPRNRPDMMAHMVLDNITSGREVTLYNQGDMWRDWTYVGDIARGVAAALDRPQGYAVVNMGRGEPVRLGDFIARIETLCGGKVNLRHAPMPAADVPRTYASIDQAKALLGYSPQTSLEDGTDALFRWYQSRPG